jgi:hypothetical protein
MVAKIHQGNTRPAIALLALLAYLAAPGFGIGPLTGALAQTPDDLDRAREHYEFAEFDQALAILARVIDRPGQTPQRLRDAYVLQARCQVGLGNRNLAEDSFCEALALDPDWRPDPIFFPRSEVEVFESARTGCPPVAATPEPTVKPVQPAPAPKTAKPWYMKPVVWAGAAAAVVVGVLVLGGGDDDEAGPPLPDPPPPPVRP